MCLHLCSAPLNILRSSCTASRVVGSLDLNQLCGIDEFGEGTYTAEGFNKLCESLKTSSITSLRCADTFSCAHVLSGCKAP